MKARGTPLRLCFGFVLALALLSPLPSSGATLARTRMLLGTVVTVTLWDPAEEKLEGGFEAAFGAMAEVDREMGRRPGTALWDLNQAGGGTATPGIAEVLSSALAWARRTRGAFDPTVAPLRDLWDLSAAPHPPPSAERIRRALARVGWQRVEWAPSARKLGLAGTALDFGGIAKGFAIDRAVAALRAAGLRDFLVDAGGDVFVAGSKGGKPWRVGIQHPRDPGRLLRVMEPREGALLTSGDYQRGFEWQGSRFHHLLDTRTGSPFAACQSVTLWAPRATLIPSAAVFLLGPKEGLALLASIPGAEGLIVDARGRVWESPGFARVAPEVSGP